MDLEVQFSKISADYDAQRPFLIPCFNEFYGAAENVLSRWGATQKKRISAADLGAGTGIMTERILKNFPQASVLLLDLSDKMLDVARRKFCCDANISYLCKDFFSLADYPPKFDAIVSALAIHHIGDADKKRLFSIIFSKLADGGIFVNAEQVLCESQSDTRAALEERAAVVENVFGNDEQAKAVAKERFKLDRCAKVSSQIDWITECGFSKVECVWRKFDYAVLTAVK